MDPELAFIQANLVQARPNQMILDPFCGTGGLMLPAAHFVSFVLGSEVFSIEFVFLIRFC